MQRAPRTVALGEPEASLSNLTGRRHTEGDLHFPRRGNVMYPPDPDPSQLPSPSLSQELTSSLLRVPAAHPASHPAAFAPARSSAPAELTDFTPPRCTVCAPRLYFQAD